jgi:molybdopterin molybdotransferase
MDGYAFAGAQLGARPGPGPAAVVGTALAGGPGRQRRQASVVKIMTGAIMPPGLDTVVPQEFVQAARPSRHHPAGLLRPGDNRRFKGEDLMAGQPRATKRASA